MLKSGLRAIVYKQFKKKKNYATFMENWKTIRVCLVTVFFFPLFYVSKNNFLFLRLKNLFGNPKLIENKNHSENSICEGN